MMLGFPPPQPGSHSRVVVRKTTFAFVGLCLSAAAGCDLRDNPGVELSKIEVVLPESGPRMKALSALVRDRCAIDRSIAEELERPTAQSRIASIKIAKSVDPAFTGMAPATADSREGLDFQRGGLPKPFTCGQLSCAANAGDPSASYYYARDITDGKCPGSTEDAVAILEASLAAADVMEESSDLRSCWDHLGSSINAPDDFYLCRYGLAESWRLLGISLQSSAPHPNRDERIEYAFQAAWKLGRQTRPARDGLRE